MSTIEENPEIKTPDGLVDAFLVRPESSEPLPAVINLTDGLGFRSEFAEQSKRIAERGYVVLTPNIFYRVAKPPVYPADADFASERGQERFKALKKPLTPDAMARDGMAYVDWLSSQPFVSSGPIGVVGFCFAGKFALEVAAARPDRIGAAASFHGGGLFTDTLDSPHIVLPRVRARLYFAHADRDHSMPTEAIEKFEWALQSWGGDYASEVYEAKHGWMIPGRQVYHPENAARGFDKLMELFDDALQSGEHVAKAARARPNAGRTFADNAAQQTPYA
jgi:carboxymethylenebutenolidase